MTGDQALMRSAHHEAGHAVAAHVMQWTPGPVTVARGGQWGGCASPAPPPLPDYDPFDSEVVPFVAWPAALQTAITQEAVVACCGPAAEGLLSVGHVAAVVAVAAPEPVLEPSPAAVQWAERAVRSEVRRTDGEVAEELARAAFLDEAVRHAVAVGDLAVGRATGGGERGCGPPVR
jgi:hypothetical protein